MLNSDKLFSDFQANKLFNGYLNIRRIVRHFQMLRLNTVVVDLFRNKIAMIETSFLVFIFQ